jgi:hypothetical protein
MNPFQKQVDVVVSELHKCVENVGTLEVSIHTTHRKTFSRVIINYYCRELTHIIDSQKTFEFFQLGAELEKNFLEKEVFSIVFSTGLCRCDS